ncbi:HNH endonuclease [Mesorhizobium sp.]|uniref:HNH endonuclease n=1 Tax=Mesorhizobium sp. TaxID=1871066 RepID=UPI001220FE79|nr:HNH endonuclease [Mesorhizobium sp.]TIN80725.1 MAG: hypothetical protein E5Y09_02565 [Mesorhizobium sp.]
MIVSKPLPDQAVLQALLTYDPLTGELTWRPRPSTFFENGKGYGERVAASWNNKFAGKPAFNTPTNTGHLKGRLFRTEYLAHRVIWKLVHGEEPDQIDHDNGDGANNRLKNLKSVPHVENQHNMKRSIRNKSGVVGVCWVSKERRWLASIHVGRKNIALGYFKDFGGAVSARLDAEREHGFNENHGRSVDIERFKMARAA